MKRLTFIVPLRIESEKRLWNLEFLLTRLRARYQNRIIVVENNAEPKLTKAFIDKYNIQYIFENTKDYPEWSRPRMANKGLVLSDTEISVIQDTDMIVDYDYFDKYIINNIDKFDYFFGPKELYEHSGDLLAPDGPLEPERAKFKFVRYSHPGGIHVAKTEMFIKAGGMSEYFNNYAWDDVEIGWRMAKLKYRVEGSRYPGIMLHLAHPRPPTLQGKSWWAGKDENGEYFKIIARFTKEELEKYVLNELKPMLDKHKRIMD